MNEYIPQVGDVFECKNKQYYCLRSTPFTGLVKPTDEEVLRKIIWNYLGDTPKFIKQATEDSMRKFGVNFITKPSKID
jgi:hypothetical protein